MLVIKVVEIAGERGKPRSPRLCRKNLGSEKMNINYKDLADFRRQVVADGFMRNSSLVYNYTGKEKLKEQTIADEIHLYIKPVSQGFVHLAIFANEKPANGEINFEIGTAFTFSRDDIFYGEKPYWKNITTDNGREAYRQAHTDSGGFENIATQRGYVAKRFPGQNKVKAKVRAFLRMVKHFFSGTF